MKKLRILLATAVIFSMILAGCGGKTGDGGKDNKMVVATLAQIDAWPAYDIKTSGLAKEKGIDFDMKLYPAGIPMVEDVSTLKWQIGDAGAVPAILGVLNHKISVIGVAADESAANAIVAKEGNSVFGQQTEENIFGNADSVRGKTFVTTTISSAHYTLDKYLKKLGLSEKDVIVRPASQEACLKALENNEADFAVLWAPYLYDAQKNGAKVVAKGSQLGATNYMLYLADTEWAKKNPEKVAKFLHLAASRVEAYHSPDSNEAISKFFKEYAKVEVSPEMVEQERASHHILTIDEQLKIMEDGSCAQSLDGIARFFLDNNKFAESNYGSLVKNNFGVDSSYLKMAKDMK